MNKNPKEYRNILKSFKKKSTEQENIPEILKDESVIIEHFQKQGNHSHFNSLFLFLFHILHYLTTVVCIVSSFSSQIYEMSCKLYQKYYVKSVLIFQLPHQI
jgi:hypothetical protein